MYKILIVGHGNFPSGAESAITLITGKHDNISSLAINNELGHEYLELEIKKYLQDNDHVIVFADMSGGAPHQITARAIVASGKKTQFVVSGAPLSFLIQIILLTPKDGDEPSKVKQILKDTLQQSFSTSRVMSN